MNYGDNDGKHSRQRNRQKNSVGRSPGDNGINSIVSNQTNSQEGILMNLAGVGLRMEESVHQSPKSSSGVARSKSPTFHQRSRANHHASLTIRKTPSIDMSFSRLHICCDCDLPHLRGVLMLAKEFNHLMQRAYQQQPLKQALIAWKIWQGTQKVRPRCRR